MDRRIRLTGFGVAATALLALACLIPTERSDELRVETLTEIPALLLGKTATLDVRVVTVGSEEVVHGVLLAYRSSDPTVIAVDSAGVLRGIATGSAVITVYAPQYANAKPATFTVRVLYALGEGVANFFPDTVMFGSLLTIVGRNLHPDSLESVEIGRLAAPIYGFSRSADPQRDTLRVWVPPAPPRATARITWTSWKEVVLGLTILQRDLYEPNDESPALLTAPFEHPLLVLEPGTGANPTPFTVVSRDWYRVAPPPSGDLTVRFHADATGDELFLGRPETSIPARRFAGRCNGLEFGLPTTGDPLMRLDRDTVVIALRGVSDTLGLFVLNTASDSAMVTYSLTLVDGYVSGLEPDDYEENDFCDRAAQVTFGDTLLLTFDTPSDFDWFRLTIADGAHLVTATVTSDAPEFLPPILRLYGDSSAATPTWAPPGGALPKWGEETVPGTIQAMLAPGDYRLLAVNFGQPESRYHLRVTATALSFVFAQDPIVAEAGAPITPSVRVAAHRPDGSIDTAFDGEVTLTIAEGTGTPGAHLRGTSARVAVAGVATFDDLSIDSVGTDYALSASVRGAVVAASAPFDVTPAPAHRVRLVPSDLSLRGVGRTGAFTGVVVDSLGNELPGVLVTWESLNDNVATVDGAGTVTAVARGQVPIRAAGGGVEGYGLVTTQMAVEADAAHVTMFGRVDVPTSAQLNALWGSGPDDVWSVGEGGTILRWDGMSWTSVASPTTADLFALWGSGPNDVWAVGADGVAVHFDGAGWRQFLLDPPGTYHDVWGSDPANVYAVGWSEADSSGRMSRWKGLEWQEHEPPTDARVTAITGTGASAVFTASYVPFGLGVWHNWFHRLDAEGWELLVGILCSDKGCPDVTDMHPFGRDTIVTLWGATLWYPTLMRALFGTTSGTWRTEGTLIIPGGNAFWGSHFRGFAQGELFVVGEGTLGTFWQGGFLDHSYSVQGEPFQAVWGMAPHDVWVASAGVMLRGYRGASTYDPAPGVDTLAVGDTLRLVPAARDAWGNPLDGILYQWSGCTGSVCELVDDVNGVIRALTPGVARATASTLGGASFSEIVDFEIVVVER